MVKNGQSDLVHRVTFDPFDPASAGVEMTSFASLRALPAGGRVPTTQRADFYVLAEIQAGRGSVMVDFDHFDLAPGAVVCIQPGRVHRWDDITDVAGWLVLFLPELAPRGVGPSLATTWQSADEPALLHAAIDHLGVELRATSGRRSPSNGAVLTSLLDVLLHRAVPTNTTNATADATFAAYASCVEQNFAGCRDVGWYAGQLGYSPRTLSRATHRVVGRSAKQFIDDRVVLEAQRLLVHEQLSVARCARTVGFDDVSNFSKFFRSRTGVTPAAFAETMRSSR